MILERHDTHASNPYASLMIQECHGEYAPALFNHAAPRLVDSTSVAQLTPWRAHCIWSFWALTSAAESAAGPRSTSTMADYDAHAAKVEAAFTTLFPTFPLDGAEGEIWQISGTLSQLELLARHMMDVIGAAPTGSDDDCFDYWPSAVRCTYDFCRDLDTLTLPAQHPTTPLQTSNTWLSEAVAVVTQRIHELDPNHDQDDWDDLMVTS